MVRTCGLVALLGGAIVLAACGGEGEQAGGAGAAGETTSVVAGGEAVAPRCTGPMGDTAAWIKRNGGTLTTPRGHALVVRPWGGGPDSARFTASDYEGPGTSCGITVEGGWYRYRYGYEVMIRCGTDPDAVCEYDEEPVYRIRPLPGLHRGRKHSAGKHITVALRHLSTYALGDPGRVWIDTMAVVPVDTFTTPPDTIDDQP